MRRARFLVLAALLLGAGGALAEPSPSPPSAPTGIAPPQADEVLHRVTTGIYLNHLNGVDIKNGVFNVDFYIWFRWEGEGIKPLETFELANGRITSKGGVVKKKIGKENYALGRILATINKPWDMTRYPLDGHTLTLEVEDIEEDERTILYVLDKENTGRSPDLVIPGWVVAHEGAEVQRHVYHSNYGDVSWPANHEYAYSRFVFAMDVVRPGYGRFLKVFFGLFISVLISWCAFWVRPKESSPRVSLGVGATFAAAAVTVAINNSLPDTNSVTMADKLMMLTLGSIVASVAATIWALTLFAHGKEDAQKRLDRVCAFAFPAVYIVLLFWIMGS